MADRKRIFRGDRLRALREARQLTQDELADLVGFGQSQLNKYENNKSEPTLEIISRLAREFGVTSDYLLGLVDNPNDSLQPQDLSPLEHKLLAAFRRGDLRELMRVAAEETPRNGTES